MTRSLFLFGTLLFALANALSTPSKRQSVEKVKDGGFEDVPQKCIFGSNESCGGWTIKGIATFDEAGAAAGDQYATFSPDRPNQGLGTVSQRITGLGDGSYTLSYALRLLFSEKDCTLSVTLGSQEIDSIYLPSTRGGSNDDFATRRVIFVPSVSSGTLAFRTTCTGHGRAQIDIDSVSLTGPA